MFTNKNRQSTKGTKLEYFFDKISQSLQLQLKKKKQKELQKFKNLNFSLKRN